MRTDINFPEVKYVVIKYVVNEYPFCHFIKVKID